MRKLIEPTGLRHPKIGSAICEGPGTTIRAIEVFFVAFLCVAIPVASQAGVLIPVVPVPGADFTLATDINENNIIAGIYFVCQPNCVKHGFFGTLAGRYTTFNSRPAGTEAIWRVNTPSIAPGTLIRTCTRTRARCSR